MVESLDKEACKILIEKYINRKKNIGEWTNKFQTSLSILERTTGDEGNFYGRGNIYSGKGNIIRL